MTAIKDIRETLKAYAGERVKIVLGPSAERGLVAGLHLEDKDVQYGKFGSLRVSYGDDVTRIVPVERTREFLGWEIVKI